MVYSVYVYDKAWRTQYLFFYDWGIFAEAAMNTLRGEFMMDYYEKPGEIFFSRHFQPGFFAFFIPLMWLFSSPYTVMVLGALFLSGSSVLVFYFARLRKLPPVFAFCCSLVYLLYPTITNYNLSFLYGFHVVYFFIPVFILFCCLYERKKESAAFLVFLFSLTIKETVGAFWVGWGICQFFSGHRKRGIVYALVGGFWLLLCLKVIIPSFSADNNYMYMGAFGHLGESIGEIALSPILRPGDFWGGLLAQKKMMLLILLILPVFMGAVVKPAWVACGTVTFLFVLLRKADSLDHINLYIQHTMEISLLLILSFAAAVSYVFRGKRNHGIALLCIGMPKSNGGRTGWALLAGGLFCSICAYSQLAQGLHTKNHAAIQSFWARKSQIHFKDTILSMVPPSSSIACDHYTASLMIASGLKIMHQTNKDADFYFYDLAGKYGSIDIGFHDGMLKNQDVGLVWFKFTVNNAFYLFQRNAPSKFSYPLLKMSEEEWLKAGNKIEIPQNSAFFEVRLLPDRNTEGHLKIKFSIKVLAPLDKYYNVASYFSNGGENQYFNIPFAFWIVPPKEIKVGDVFRFEVDLPIRWTSLQSGGCKMEEI